MNSCSEASVSKPALCLSFLNALAVELEVVRGRLTWR